MAAAIWLNAAIFTVLLLTLRRPVTRDVAPRLRVEIVAVIVTAVVGSAIGGSAGLLVSLAGVTPLLVVGLLRRRVIRLEASGLHEHTLRTLDVLDAVSWPVDATTFNLHAREEVLLRLGRMASMHEHLARLRRPTRASDLMSARLSRDPERIAATARGLLDEPASHEDHYAALAALAWIDLPACIDWLDSSAGRRVASRASTQVALLMLSAAGRTEVVGRLADHHGVSQLRRAEHVAMAELAAGAPADVALAPLDAFGDIGRWSRDDIAARGISAQPLDERRAAFVRRLETDMADASTVLGRDVGRWRPVVSMTLGALLLAAWVLQRSAGPVTAERMYDQGGFLTGPDWEPWRAFAAPYLHANTAHVLVNVLGLLALGRIVEGRLGRARHLAIWLCTSSGAFLAIGLLDREPRVHIGASGGVLGMLGAGLAVVALGYRATRSVELARSAQWLLGIMALQLVADQLISGISWQTHVAGLAIGLTLGAAAATAQRGTLSAAETAHEYRSE